LAIFLGAITATFTLAIGAFALGAALANYSLAWARRFALALAIGTAFATLNCALAATVALAVGALTLGAAFGAVGTTAVSSALALIAARALALAAVLSHDD